MEFAIYVAQKRAGNTKKGVLKPTADALERWTTRIAARQLHLMGEAGADRYLADYGRGIAAPKCIALAVVCEANNYLAIAEGFWKKAYQLETGLTPEFSTPETTQIDDEEEIYFERSTPTPVCTNPFPPHLQPGHIVTMQPVDAIYPRQHYIDDDCYLGQPKIDGNRLVVIVDPQKVHFQSRSTRLRPSPDRKLHDSFLDMIDEVGPFILDGELVYYSWGNKEHRTGAQAAQVNIDAGCPELQPMCKYEVFECLYCHGVDLTDASKVDRITEANDLVDTMHRIGLDPEFHIEVLPTAFTQEEKETLVANQQTNLREGEVWTLKYSSYIGGKDEHNETTVRTKYMKEFEAAILALTPTTAEGRPFGAIQIGMREAGYLKPIGSIGTGYTVDEMREIYNRVARADYGTVMIKVKCQGFTENGQVWQGRYLGFAEE